MSKSNEKIKQSVICLYKRFRLTRNLNRFKFTAAMTTDQSIQVKEQIKETFQFCDGLRQLGLTEVALESRFEQLRAISQGLLMADPLKSNLSAGLYRSADRQFHLSVNDVDHLRMDLVSYQASFDDLWQTLDILDDGISQSLDLAYQEPFGYLTSRIEQLGTGLNGEALLHLPALRRTGFIHSLSESMGVIGVQIKPLRSDFYIVFNTVTLGRNEVELALLLDQVVEKITQREMAGRETLLVSEAAKYKDSIGRAYGQCRYGVLAEEEEAVAWLSSLLLGESYGLLQSDFTAVETATRWHDYLNRISDGGLEASHQKNMSYREKMQARAGILNEIHGLWNWRG